MSIHRCVVRAAQRVGPGFVRVTLGGPGLAGFTSTGVADEYVRLFLPDGPDRTQVRLPLPTQGAWSYPDGVRPSPIRTYTVRAVRAAPNVEVDIDVAVHEDGLGVRWAQQARPGDVVGMTSPCGVYAAPDRVARQTLVTDLSGLPAAARLLETTGAQVRTTVVIEVPDAAHEVSLARPARAQIRWVHGGNGHGPSRLEDVVRALPRPVGDGSDYVWVAGETKTLRGVRAYLRRELRLPASAYKVVGYWIENAQAWQRDFDGLPPEVRAELFSMWESGRDAEEIEDDYVARLESLGL